MIDYGEDRCNGKCVLVNDMRPGIDASSRPYCAQATITVVRPMNRKDSPIVEIYFEKPERGCIGKVYAFRGTMETSDGPDYIRFRRDFEALWAERFPSAKRPCKDE